jgi:hypothetical protein
MTMLPSTQRRITLVGALPHSRATPGEDHRRAGVDTRRYAVTRGAGGQRDHEATEDDRNRQDILGNRLLEHAALERECDEADDEYQQGAAEPTAWHRRPDQQNQPGCHGEHRECVDCRPGGIAEGSEAAADPDGADGDRDEPREDSGSLPGRAHRVQDRTGTSDGTSPEPTAARLFGCPANLFP